MDAIQAIDMINSWRRILIEGKPEQIDSMLADVEARLKEKGFVRDSATEKEMNWHADQRDTLFCFVGGPRDGPRLLLCLNRVTERRVRGGTYSFVEGALDAGPLEVATVVEDVIGNVIVPSASLFGLKVTKPRLGLNSLVPPRTRAALFAFTDVAAGAWPEDAPAETAWRQFLIVACQEEVAFDTDELMDWFVINGWSPADARSLVARFISEATLLTEYAEAIRS